MAMIQLPPDFKEFLQLLNSCEVEYLLDGGYAVAFHGYPRTTGDIDIWITPTRANAEKVLAVLAKFGFGGMGATIELLQEPDKIIRMGNPP
ncbi:MAG: nucleotidyltransferase domain-containing protein, partial [bacterium]